MQQRDESHLKRIWSEIQQDGHELIACFLQQDAPCLLDHVCEACLSERGRVCEKCVSERGRVSKVCASERGRVCEKCVCQKGGESARCVCQREGESAGGVCQRERESARCVCVRERESQRGVCVRERESQQGVCVRERESQRGVCQREAELACRASAMASGLRACARVRARACACAKRLFTLIPYAPTPALRSEGRTRSLTLPYCLSVVCLHTFGERPLHELVEEVVGRALPACCTRPFQPPH